MDDRFQDICSGIMNELQSHREEIEGGLLNWFSIKVMLKRDALQATWLSEENVVLQPKRNGNGAYHPVLKVSR